MNYDQATEMMRETIQAMGQAQGPGLEQQPGLAQGSSQGLASGPASAPGPGLVSRDVSARARLLPARSHTVVAVPAFNPDDTNSALLTYIQVSTPPPRNAPLVYMHIVYLFICIHFFQPTFRHYTALH